jgi:hypothetical protein
VWGAETKRGTLAVRLVIAQLRKPLQRVQWLYFFIFILSVFEPLPS